MTGLQVLELLALLIALIAISCLVFARLDRKPSTTPSEKDTA